jgi:predicted ATPase/Tfp pilus assembly protein PilF
VPESVVSFQSLPPDYQQVIQMAEERYGIAVSPLQELAGGWSGAIIYLVRVASTDSGRVQHLILKLERKHPKSSADEVSRHLTVQRRSPPAFTRQHIPELAYERLELENALAIFYTIAGQSLHKFRTLSNYRRQSRLETLFSATNHYLLQEWNANLTFESFDHPQRLLESWLGFRLQPGQKIETFLKDVCHLPPSTPGFIVQGNLLPNPLYYARNAQAWGSVRPLDVMLGLQHGDLNTNNILAKFSRQGDQLEGYYLIDFALFKENKPLLYDQRYLEMSYLVHAITQGSFSSAVELICRFSEHDFLESEQAPIEIAGVNAAIQAGRRAFQAWVQENHPSLHDDLWGQYWLAGTAAGLGYCHKAGLEDEIRLAGLVFAAANLKRYFDLFSLSMPSEASQLSLAAQIEGIPEGVILASRDRKIINNLPISPTNFIGRKTELAEVTGLLRRPQVRLVTLTGPGGTGKTRLGLEVGRALVDQFPDGVYFVDLAQIHDPSLVPATTAHTIGIREGGSRPPLETLKDSLAAKNMLLILDNFEQVTTARTDLAQLLAAAPAVKALVTSRIPLQLRAEQEYPVSPLAMPPDGRQSLDETLEFESIALFQQQARAVRPGFEITQQNRDAIVAICRRLDGLPLAIEIAAARVKMLSPQALLKRLDHSLNLLVGGAKDLPDRQQTLRRTIDWSYDLLEPEQKSLFTRLGVFVGGFTLEAAEDVSKPVDGIDIFPGIEVLLNNSLLRQVRSASDEPRFDMLQTIREYALEKATAAGILDELRRAHCDYFTRLAGSAMGEGVYGAQSTMWLQRYDEEHDNYRLALSWALEHPDQGAQPVIVMMRQLTWFWFRYGYLQEGSEWTERMLAATEGMGDAIPHAFALVGRAYLALWSGDLIVAAQLGRQAVEMGQRLGLDEVISFAQFGYGVALINQGKDREAYPHLVDAVELFDEQNQSWFKGTALVHLANVSLGLGQANQALQWLDTAMPLLKASGDIWNVAFGLNNYGEVARAQGDYETAESYYRRTQELFEQADAKGDQARLVHTFGYIAQHKGHLRQARALFLQSLDDFRELGNHRGIAECLAGLAGLAAEQGKYEWAVPLLSAAESQLKAFGGAWWPADRVEIERARERMQSALGDQFQTLWVQGQSMPVEKAITYATQGV